MEMNCMGYTLLGLKGRIDDLAQIIQKYDFFKLTTGKEHIRNVRHHEMSKPWNSRH